MSPAEVWVKQADGEWKARGRTYTPSVPGPTWANTLILDENWDTLDTEKWFREIGTYGSAQNRIQYYRHENVVISPATAGGNGNSLKLISKRESYSGAAFTAGMLGTRDLGVYYPRYGRYEAKMRIPHGHGVWPAFWLRHRDGSFTCEPDIMEYFIGQVPGKVGPQLHRVNNAGTFQVNVMPYTSDGYTRIQLYEAPVAEGAQAWVTIAMDILPWSASTIAGGTLAATNAANTNVIYRMYYDGVLRYQWLDTQSLNWSQRYDAEAFDICIQGSQIGGNYVGHPDDPLGYSRWLNGGSCIVGGTAPNSCTTTVGGYTNRVADFPNTLELDYVRVWRYTP